MTNFEDYYKSIKRKSIKNFFHLKEPEIQTDKNFPIICGISKYPWILTNSSS